MAIQQSFICALCVSIFIFEKNPFNGINRSRKVTFANASRLFLAMSARRLKMHFCSSEFLLLILANFLPRFLRRVHVRDKQKMRPCLFTNILPPLEIRHEWLLQLEELQLTLNISKRSEVVEALVCRFKEPLTSCNNNRADDTTRS